MTAPVLVTGATGRIGGAVVARLLERQVPVRVLTHRPEAASALPAGVEAVIGDLTAPDSLAAALDGVGAVLLVWTVPGDSAAAALERLATAARRVVFVSAPHRTPHPFFQQPNPMAALFTEIERLIEVSGIESTIVRPGVFASNASSWWAPTIRAGGVVRWPYAAAQTAPVDDRDVAAVIARCLVEPAARLHTGGDLVLTGPEPLSQAEQVAIIGEVLGRPVRFEELTPDEFRHETGSTWPRPVVEMLLGAWGATMGHSAYVTSTVAEVLGSPARPFRQWVADHAADFGG